MAYSLGKQQCELSVCINFSCNSSFLRGGFYHPVRNLSLIDTQVKLLKKARVKIIIKCYCLKSVVFRRGKIAVVVEVCGRREVAHYLTSGRQRIDFLGRSLGVPSLKVEADRAAFHSL